MLPRLYTRTINIKYIHWNFFYRMKIYDLKRRYQNKRQTRNLVEGRWWVFSQNLGRKWQKDKLDLRFFTGFLQPLNNTSVPLQFPKVHQMGEIVMLESEIFSLLLSSFTEFKVIRVSGNITISVFHGSHCLWNIQSKIILLYKNVCVIWWFC